MPRLSLENLALSNKRKIRWQPTVPFVWPLLYLNFLVLRSLYWSSNWDNCSWTDDSSVEIFIERQFQNRNHAVFDRVDWLQILNTISQLTTEKLLGKFHRSFSSLFARLWLIKHSITTSSESGHGEKRETPKIEGDWSKEKGPDTHLTLVPNFLMRVCWIWNLWLSDLIVIGVVTWKYSRNHTMVGLMKNARWLKKNSGRMRNTSCRETLWATLLRFISRIVILSTVFSKKSINRGKSLRDARKLSRQCEARIWDWVSRDWTHSQGMNVLRVSAFFRK